MLHFTCSSGTYNLSSWVNNLPNTFQFAQSTVPKSPEFSRAKSHSPDAFYDVPSSLDSPKNTLHFSKSTLSKSPLHLEPKSQAPDAGASYCLDPQLFQFIWILPAVGIYNLPSTFTPRRSLPSAFPTRLYMLLVDSVEFSIFFFQQFAFRSLSSSTTPRAIISARVRSGLSLPLSLSLSSLLSLSLSHTHTHIYIYTLTKSINHSLSLFLSFVLSFSLSLSPALLLSLSLILSLSHPQTYTQHTRTYALAQRTHTHSRLH
jgi:hypothetical protein